MMTNEKYTRPSGALSNAARIRDTLSIVARIAMIVIMCATIAALVYNVRFSHPGADDYRYSRLIEQLNEESFVAHRYRTWNGRFASDIWYTVLYSIIDVRSRYWPGSLMMILIFTILPWYIYARFLCAQNSALRERQGLAPPIYLAATLLFLYLLPIRTASILYIVSVAVPYQVGAAHLLLQMIGFCLVIRAVHRGAKRTWLHALAVVGLSASALFISGYQESFVLLSLLYYGLGLLWSLLHSRRTAWIWIAPCVMAIIGGLIVYYAPGNDVRIAVSDTVTITDYSVLSLIGRYVSVSIYGIIRFMGVLFACIFVLWHVPPTKKYLSLYTHLFDGVIRSCTPAFRIIVIVSYPIIVVAGILPAIYALGGIGPPRLHAAVFFFLIINFGLFWASIRTTSLYKWVKKRFFDTYTQNPKAKTVKMGTYMAIVALIAGSVAIQFDSVREKLPVSDTIADRIVNPFPATVYNLIRDALYAGPRYHSQQKQIYDSFTDFPDKQQAHVTIAPFCPFPLSIIDEHERISTMPTGYPNNSLKDEFDFKSIRTNPALYCYNNNKLIAR